MKLQYTSELDSSVEKKSLKVKIWIYSISLQYDFVQLMCDTKIIYVIEIKNLPFIFTLYGPL